MTYEQYWEIMFGEERSPATVVLEYRLVTKGLDMWFAEAEAEALALGELTTSLVSKYHRKALRKLQSAVIRLRKS